MYRTNAPPMEAIAKPPARSFFPGLWQRLRTTATGFGKLDPLKEAASLAYTTIFAIPGVLILTLFVAGLLYDAGEVRTALFHQLGGLVGAETGKQLEAAVSSSAVEGENLFAKIVGITTLIVGATAAFASLQGSLNRIWQVEAEPGRAVWRYVLTRLVSLGLIAAFGFMLLVSLVLDTVLVAVAERMGAWLPGRAVLVGVAGMLGSFAVVTVVFAVVFKWLPDVRIRWRWVWAGAFFTAILFTVGKYLIGLYIAKTEAGSAYGASGAIIVLLLWVYYSAILLLFGAQYTRVTALEHHERIQPKPHMKVREAA